MRAALNAYRRIGSRFGKNSLPYRRNRVSRYRRFIGETAGMIVREPRIGLPAGGGGQTGNARRILQVKQDEDEWTKGSFRQMNEDARERDTGREARGKREMG